MTLPLAVVERLFQRLTATYGSEFVNKWDKVPIADVKTAWAHELAFTAEDLNIIGWALNNLPDRCPNLIEFKSLCKQAPRATRIALEAKKAPVEVVDRVMQEIVSKAFKTPRDEKGNIDHKRWAKKLKARHEAGESLNIYQIKCYKEALQQT